MRRVLYLLLFYIFAFLVIPLNAAAQQQKPNVIIIYTDDLGYGDISCYGAKNVHTPNIDRIAVNGLLFTNAHNPEPQLYYIKNDIGEKHNLAKSNPGKLVELKNLLQNIINR